MSQTPLSGRTASKLQLLYSPRLTPIVKRARNSRAFFWQSTRGLVQDRAAVCHKDKKKRINDGQLHVEW